MAKDIKYNVENPSYNQTSGYKFYFGDGIEFDKSKGTYKLTGTIKTDNSAIVSKNLFNI